MSRRDRRVSIGFIFFKFYSCLGSKLPGFRMRENETIYENAKTMENSIMGKAWQHIVHFI